MKIVIVALLLIVGYAWVCIKGYEDGFRVGRRHHREQVFEAKGDLSHGIPFRLDSSRNLREVALEHIDLVPPIRLYMYSSATNTGYVSWNGGVDWETVETK